jgi:ribose-phosphate pyrophosphokinase
VAEREGSAGFGCKRLLIRSGISQRPSFILDRNPVSRKLIIFSGRSNPAFGRAIGESLGMALGGLEVVPFSDGELNVDIKDNVRGRDVFIIQSTCMPCNEFLMELLITLDALKRASAARVTAVMPYFGYARQDRKVKPRVPITAKLVADLLTVAGASRILTADLHAGQIMGFFNIPVDNLNAFPILCPFIRSNYGGADELTVVSPDAGGVERARIFATRLDNTPMAIIDKRRTRPNHVAEMKVVGDVQGRTCVIVDDMIDTASTLCKAAATLVAAGANRVLAVATHGVLSGEAVERIEASPLERVVITDSIPLAEERIAQGSKIAILSIAPLFAEAIRRIHGDDSVSSLCE